MNQCPISNLDLGGMCPKLSVDPVDLPTTSGKPNQCPFSYVDPVDKWLIFTYFMSMCPKVSVDSVDKW